MARTSTETQPRVRWSGKRFYARESPYIRGAFAVYMDPPAELNGVTVKDGLESEDEAVAMARCLDMIVYGIMPHWMEAMAIMAQAPNTGHTSAELAAQLRFEPGSNGGPHPDVLERALAYVCGSEDFLDALYPHEDGGWAVLPWGDE